MSGSLVKGKFVMVDFVVRAIYVAPKEGSVVGGVALWLG
jgi:hypothetical protein